MFILTHLEILIFFKDGIRRNINIYDEVDKQGEFLAYCKSKGVGIYIGDPGSVSEKEIDHGNEMEEQRVEQENVNEE